MNRVDDESRQGKQTAGSSVIFAIRESLREKVDRDRRTAKKGTADGMIFVCESRRNESSVQEHYMLPPGASHGPVG